MPAARRLAKKHTAVVVRLKSPSLLRRLRGAPGPGRIVALTTLHATPRFTISAWRGALASAAGDANLDLAVTPSGRSKKRALNEYLSLLKAPPSGLANLWVAPSGGACTRSASPVAYHAAVACASMNAAYQTAALGDTVIVTCASGSSCTYPQQTVREQASKAGTAPARHVLIEPDPTKTVTIYGIETGTGAGGSGSNGADHITFARFAMPNDGSHDCTIDLRPDTWDVTLNHVSVCSFYMDIVHDITVKDSRFGPCNSGSGVCTNSRIEGGDVASGVPANTNIRILGSVFHDYLRANSNQHFECMVAWADTDGLTLRGNKFVRCAVFDLFLSNQGHFTDTLVENNWFDLPTDVGTDYAPRGQVAVGIRNDSCFRNITFRNNSFAPNTKVGWPGTSCVPFVNAKEIGDISTFFDCRIPGVSSSYNVGGEACPGTGNIRVPLASLYKLSAYLGRGGNLHLLSARTPAARRVPISLCPSVDIDGDARKGSFCDAGSDER
jgi:hypothetical protein